MQEDSYQYTGRPSLVCRKTVISMREDPHQYAGRQLLVCRKTLISMQEDSYQYTGRPLLVCRKTVISIQEDPHWYAGRQKKTLTPRFTDFFTDFGKKNRPFCSLRKTLIRYGGRQLCILIKGRQGKTTSLKFIPLSLLASILLADRSHRSFRERMGSPFYPSTLSFRKPRSFFRYSSGCYCFLHSYQ